ncbi:aldehyde dehydrogenase family protein [Nonomuraea sp. SYSU D8015]|uniref:aldehyde dehydrogenase family protein n=1 Tax=Nonomuraea sp. SYSU D8015 TaxID=2593644 RepID=UPI0016617B4A|nr:aldehyde dehydrogenase family protein [Nonomuraea sp. SYSU D8015]
MQPGTSFSSIDPWTGAERRRFADATAADLDKALAAAAEAFPLWGGFDPAPRAALLRRIADELTARRGELVKVAGEETGLPERRLEGEVERTSLQLTQFARLIENGDHFDAVIDPAAGGAPDVRRVNVPLGPVAVFAASNFPFVFSVAGTDTAAALAAGCPVIVKGHPSHPETAELTAAAVAAAGAPIGVFHLLQASGLEIAQRLVTAPEIAAVAFTGSLAGGRAIFDLAAARPRPIPVYAEMGSLNPVFLLPGALAESPERLAEAYADSLTSANGQLCTKPGVLFLPRGEAGDRFLTHAAHRLRDRPPAIMLNASMWERLVVGVAEAAERPGVRLLAGESAPDGAGFAFPSTLLESDLHAFLADPVLREERFGPFGVVVRYDDPAELTAVARSLDGHLTGTIHLGPGESELGRRLAGELTARVGRIVWNGWPTGVAVTGAMHHGGPYPATTNAAATSVGTNGIARFLRPVAYQDSPQDQLPPPLRDANPLRIARKVAGRTTTEPIITTERSDAARGAVLLPTLPAKPQPSPEAARVLEEVPGYLGVPFVSPIFQALAGYPDYLVPAWDRFKPVLGSPAFKQAAAGLGVPIGLLPPREAWPAAAGHDLRLSTVTFHRLLPELLLLASCWYRGLAVGDSAVPVPPDPGPRGIPPEALNLVPDATPPDEELVRVYEEIRILHDHPRVLSYYRAIGSRPGFLPEVWKRLEPIARGADYATAREKVLAKAAAAAATLPVPGVDTAHADDVRAILAIFRLRLIPSLLLDTAVVLALLGEDAAIVTA